MTLDALVIGAGLSGLTAALRLHEAGATVAVLEARNRVGGRALSLPGPGGGGLDLGPAWIWPDYQPRVRQLVDRFGLQTIAQFEDGAFVFEDASGIRKGSFPKRYGDAVRIRGGAQRLAEALHRALPAACVRLDTRVTALDMTSAPTVVTDDGQRLSARQIISAVPVQLARDWSVTPPLPEALTSAMTRWPTWMAAHAKVLAVYDRPFWCDAGLSGAAISHVGPLMEIADHSDPETGLYALFGFFGVPAGQRVAESPESLTSLALAQMGRLFGPQALSPRSTSLQDWAREPMTTGPRDLEPLTGHPAYGDRVFERSWLDGRLHFAGAETVSADGGLIEGALLAGDRAAAGVLGALRSRKSA